MEEKKSGIKKFFEEFKAFAMRGNVLDMAVGVVIGGAFTAIVTALVEDIINPLIGLFFKADFSDVVIGLGGSSIKIGEFVNSIINFLIVAFVLFVVIKFVNSLHKKPEEPAEPEELLGTIHYLVSDASSFVTGALAVVDGGFDAFSI